MRSVLSQSPLEPIALAQLGFALEAQGRRDEAIAAYRSALLARPDLETVRRRIEALAGAR